MWTCVSSLLGIWGPVNDQMVIVCYLDLIIGTAPASNSHSQRHWGYDLPNNLRIWDIMQCVKYNYSTWFWTHVNGETEMLDHWICGV